MKKIKQLLFKNFNTLFPLLLVSTISLFLLMIRLKLSQSFFFLFLVWNLFLAFIPFGIAFVLKQQQSPSKIAIVIGFCAWLLFLPNAPYLVTDMIHLRHSGPLQIWLDTIMISLFAIGGLLFYLYSMRQMELTIASYVNKKYISIIFGSIHFIAGFGIYLGRFLRFNSWDIVQEPMFLVLEIGKIILFPGDHIMAWIITVGFGIFLWCLYTVQKKRQITS